MDNTNDDGHLHLVRIGEDQAVVGTVPSRVQAERIHMPIVHCVYSAVVILWEIPAGMEKMQRLGKYIVVKEPSIDGEYAHKQDDVATTVQLCQ